MFSVFEINLERYMIRRERDSVRVQWTPRRFREMTFELVKFDNRPKCGRCKQRFDSLLDAFNGHYCADCYLEIYKRVVKHCEISGPIATAYEPEQKPKRATWFERFAWLWDFTEMVGIALGLIPDKRYQDWVEGNYFGSWSEPKPIQYVEDWRTYEAMAASPCSAHRNDITGYANGDAVSRASG